MSSLKAGENKTSEDDYCSGNPEFRYKKNFFVISGCSGSGKSSLIQEISNRGYKVIHEAGRQVVKEQNFIDGDALPWKDWMKFVELTISRTMFQYNSMADEEEIVFFDRSIVDQISWQHLNIEAPIHLINAALKYRFNETVFVTPPWEEIYETDDERKHGYNDALVSYDSTVKMYEKFGYKTVLVPKISVKERADFVIDKV